MSTQDFKEVAQAVQSMATTLGLLLAGMWSYYKFVKGRILAPKLDVELESKVIRSESSFLFAATIRFKNISSVRILPEVYRVDLDGLRVDGGSLIIENLMSTDNLLPASVGRQVYNYIEPGESDLEHICMCGALSICCYIDGNHGEVFKIYNPSNVFRGMLG